MALFIIILFVISSNTHALQPCATPEQVTSFNIGFDYNGSELSALPGVNKDIQTMNDISKIVGKKTFIYRDKDVTDKHSFLESLKLQASGVDTVFFNFSGHGLVLKSGEFALMLPKAPRNCTTAKFYKKPINGFYRSVALKSQVKEESNKLSEIDTTVSLGNHISPVFDDTSKDCSRYVVKASEIADVFRGKTVFGLVDSCFSGALKNESGMNLMYSTSNTQTAIDTPSGGILFNAVKKMMHEYSCSVDSKQSGMLTLTEIMNKLPAVYFVSEQDKKVKVTTLPIEKAESLLRESIISHQNAKNNEELIRSKITNSELEYNGQTLGGNLEIGNVNYLNGNCFQLSQYDQKECKSALTSSFKLKNSVTIKCKNKNVSLETDQEAQILSDDSKKKMYLALFSNQCSTPVWINKNLLREEKNNYMQNFDLPKENTSDISNEQK